MNRPPDLSATVLSGLIAGVVFIVLDITLVPLFGLGSPWEPVRMIAAIVLGRDVLPPPATSTALPRCSPGLPTHATGSACSFISRGEWYSPGRMTLFWQGESMSRYQPVRNAAIVSLLLMTATPAHAQDEVKKSQTGTVSQMIHNTRVLLVYDRPVARGRTLFGDVVKWGEVWNPGANAATFIDVNAPVLVAGKELPAGRYSVWAIPRPQAWTVIFSKKHDVSHSDYPKGADALRAEVRPRSGAHMETLAFYFPVVGPDSAVLHLHWGSTVVPLTIRLKLP
ncbi:MAG: DUF2911 domain-containing protein [Gemmatimonadota bacterium]